MAVPFILAGPLLRRAHPARVCVWLATREPVQLTGNVFEADKYMADARRAKPIGTGLTFSIALGRFLHISLVQMLPSTQLRQGEQSRASAQRKGSRAVASGSTDQTTGAFPERTLLSYELVLLPITKEAARAKKVAVGGLRLHEHEEMMRTSGAAGDGRLIAYPPYSLPTFYLATSGRVNLLHGSCRKLHGSGVDGLLSADSLIAASVKKRSIELRPSALLLTGDQIYADDVADSLIDSIIDLGALLLGFEESVPRSSLPTESNQVKVTGLRQQVRGMMVKDLFTPDDGDSRDLSAARNQLLGFGDFAAMYIFALNPEVWPRGELKDQGAKSMLATLPSVRRVLANLPTYMIFDDHEITDDWNINSKWSTRVMEANLGRRIVANGLAAYWAFQGWGNNPDAFDEAFVRGVEQHFDSVTGPSGQFERQLLEFKKWAYRAPTNPSVLFLDARTRREFGPTPKSEVAPELMNGDSLREMCMMAQGKGQTRETAKDLSGSIIVVVAPSPVFGFPYLEQIQESSDIYVCDRESWHANRRGKFHLLDALASLAPQACVIVSGDLHYGFVSRARFDAGGTVTSFVQFTSSAIKNSIPGWASNVTIGQLAGTRSKRVEYAWRSVPRLRRPPAELRSVVESAPVVLEDQEYFEIAATKADVTIRAEMATPDGGSAPMRIVKNNSGQFEMADVSGRQPAMFRFFVEGGAVAAYAFTIDLRG